MKNAPLLLLSLTLKRLKLRQYTLQAALLVLLVPAGLGVLAFIVSRPWLAVEVKMGWMAGLALVFLLAALNGLALALRAQKHRKPGGWVRSVPPVSLALLAALMPLLVFKLPAWWQRPAGAEPLAVDLTAGQPAVYTWVTFTLLAAALLAAWRGRQRPTWRAPSTDLPTRPAANIPPPPAIPAWLLATATAAAGWLAGVYLFSILAGGLQLPSLARSGQILAAAAGLLAAPLAEEWLLRRALPGWLAGLGWQAKHEAGPRSGWLWQELFIAALFGLLQLRLLLMPSAALFSLLAGWLYRRTGDLAAPIAAHLVFNALMLFYNPLLVI